MNANALLERSITHQQMSANHAMLYVPLVKALLPTARPALTLILLAMKAFITMCAFVVRAMNLILYHPNALSAAIILHLLVVVSVVTSLRKIKPASHAILEALGRKSTIVIFSLSHGKLLFKSNGTEIGLGHSGLANEK